MNNSAGLDTTLRLEDVDLSRGVERACAYYRRAAVHKGIQLTFHAADDLSAVQTDRVLVAAIVDNLLSNAVKYSPSPCFVSPYTPKTSRTQSPWAGTRLLFEELLLACSWNPNWQWTRPTISASR